MISKDVQGSINTNPKPIDTSPKCAHSSKGKEYIHNQQYVINIYNVQNAYKTANKKN